jgi:phenylacetaldehyde dehydrogenase
MMNAPVRWTEGQRLTASTSKKPRQMLINDRWVDAQSGKVFPIHNPADGEIIAYAAAGDAVDVDLAVTAARTAFDGGPWSKMRPAERAKLLWRLGDLIDTHAEELALIETLDNGKPLQIAKMVDVASSSEKLRYYAGWATKLNGETMSLSSYKDYHAFTVHEPVGVVGQIVPWNFPLLMAVTKLAPALAAGCTVVLKCAEQTPLSAIRLGELVQAAGFPPGVVNIVTGFGETAGAALAEHPKVDKVAFTGSTEVGKLLLGAARTNLKRLTLELGGKSPLIVFPDADIDRAIECVTSGIFFNSGQGCYANSRLFAHKSVFDRVVEGVAQRAKQLKVGSGLEPDTFMGPLVSKEQLERVTGYIRAGKSDGATVLTGGEQLDRSGYFVQPTVLVDARRDMSVWREEIFGPVLCAMSYEEDDLDKIAAEANDTSFGLAAYVFTRDVGRAHQMARKLRAGTVRINDGSGDTDSAIPFGGFKQSGWGRENGREGIAIYTELKSVLVAL